MPKTKQSPEVRTRLRNQDQERLDLICRSSGKTQTEVVRQAILFYLDSHDKGQLDIGQSETQKTLQKGFDRLAAMLMRNTIDVGVVYQAIYVMMGDKAEKAFPHFYSNAVKRLQAKRKDQAELETVKELVQLLYGEPKKEPGAKE